MLPQRFQRHLAFNQNVVSGFLLFFTVGVYLAILGLGAGGGKPTSQRVSDISNLAAYSIYAVFGFFTGSILNKLGPKWTMMFGVFGYPFYVSGLFYYDRTGGQAYPIAGGIALGISAPMLWSTSGFIQWAYATELEKGTFISIQYFIAQIGSAFGSIVAFIIIYTGASDVSDGSPTPVYIAFLILMCLAFVVAWFGLVKPSEVRRADGTEIAHFRALSWKEELKGVGEVLRDFRVLAILPVAFCTELPLVIIPSLNARYFNLRTRGMNPIPFYLLALPSTWLTAYLTDKSAKTRSQRGLIAVTVVGLMVIGSWVPLTAWVSVSETFENPPTGGVDWTDTKSYAGPFVIYLLFGIEFTCHQLVGMWVFGTFSNEPRKLAVYGGLWKGIAALGLAVFFGLASAGISFRTQVIAAMALQLLSIPILYTLVIKYCSDTNYGKEVDVITPHYAEAELHIGESIPGSEKQSGEANKHDVVTVTKGEKDLE